MIDKEKDDNTCGAHEEECTNWCEIHKIWECDNCYHWCLEELRKINDKKYKHFDYRRNRFVAKIEAQEMMKT